MTLEDFNLFPEQKKIEVIVDAKKIGEYDGEFARHELFQVAKFYVEVNVNFLYPFRKIENTFELKDVPFIYFAQVLKSLSF